jgi:hypothetical protein
MQGTRDTSTDVTNRCDPTRRGLVVQRAAATLFGVRPGWYVRAELIDALHRGTRIRHTWCEQFVEWCESHDVLARRGADEVAPGGAELTHVDPEHLAREWRGFDAAFHAPACLDLRPVDATRDRAPRPS